MSKKNYLMLLPTLGLLSVLAQADPSSEPEDLFARDAASCTQLDTYMANSPVQRGVVQQFYHEQGNQLQWQSVARRAELEQQLQELRYDGLPTERYLSALHAAPQLQEPPFCQDAVISHAYLLALLHLKQGVLDGRKVEPYWLESAAALKPLANPAELARASSLEQAFTQARPGQILYARLREQLRSGPLLAQASWPQLGAGASLRPGASDARIPLLRQRLQASGHLPAADLQDDSLLYDDSLVAAVKSFQDDHLLEDDGIVGPATLKELNVSPAQRLMQIRINLERLRWFDRYLEPDMLVVDIAGARLLYLEEGVVVWRTRTQVGSAARKTPLLKSRITHLTLNPTWTVPPTILRNDKLPAIRRDPGYLQRSRMKVLDSSGRVLDPATIDWSAPGNIMLRQDAGPGNALGRVAIRFANPFAVYLHDTPSKHLFDRASRTVSSGCVRVEDVMRLLDLLAGDDATAASISRLLDTGHTRQFNLPHALPVLLAYWTVDVDAEGRLRFRADNYGHDDRVARALQAVYP